MHNYILNFEYANLSKFVKSKCYILEFNNKVETFLKLKLLLNNDDYHGFSSSYKL